MKTNLYNYGVVCLAIILLAGCGSPPITPEPTATVPPSPTQDPPTITSIPTRTPKPTKTPTPMGIFSGCTYYQGELVVAEIGFHYVPYDVDTWFVVPNSSGCVTKNLPAGSYLVHAEYYRGLCGAVGAVCMSVPDVQVEIKPGETIEMDFEIQKIN